MIMNKKGIGFEYIIGILIALVVIFVIIFMISGGFDKASSSSNQILDPENMLNLAGGAYTYFFKNAVSPLNDTELNNTGDGDE